MEKDETIADAVKREVKEETGLEFEPKGLMTVEFQPSTWYRFTLVGRVVGGSLKTPDQADKESLQGRFWPIEDVMSRSASVPIRSSDILPLIARAQEYQKALENPSPLTVLPCVSPHKDMILRTVCVRREGATYQILLSKSSTNPFLAVVVSERSNHLLASAVQGFNHIFKHTQVNYTLHGVLSVEHNGRPAHAHDGMCLTILLSLSPKGASSSLELSQSDFAWCTVTDEHLLNLLSRKISRDPLNANLKID